jgi:hypothetical protein
MVGKMALAAAALTLATALPVTPAAAQNPFAVFGGAAVGAGVGGAIGGGRGAVIGAIIGGTTAAAISREAELRQGGYYWWHGRCYARYQDGGYGQVPRDYCW